MECPLRWRYTIDSKGIPVPDAGRYTLCSGTIFTQNAASAAGEREVSAMKKNAMVRTYTTDKEEKEMRNSTMAGGTKLPGGGFHGGEQGKVLPGGGFHGGEQGKVLPGGGFHNGKEGRR